MRQRVAGIGRLTEIGAIFSSTASMLRRQDGGKTSTRFLQTGDDGAGSVLRSWIWIAAISVGPLRTFHTRGMGAAHPRIHRGP